MTMVEPRPIQNGEIDNSAIKQAIQKDQEAYQQLLKNYHHSGNEDKENFVNRSGEFYLLLVPSN